MIYKTGKPLNSKIGCCIILYQSCTRYCLHYICYTGQFLLLLLVFFALRKFANQMLKDFLILAENFYGVKRCTMNIHQLTHLSIYVLERGPLWAYSCFAFEGFNAVIKSLVHGTHHAAEQIGYTPGLSLGLPRLVEKIFCDFIFLPPKVKKSFFVNFLEPN